MMSLNFCNSKTYFFSILILIMFSGCSSPYIQPVKHTLIHQEETYYGDLPKLIDVANNKREELFDKVSGAAEFKSFINNSLLVLAPVGLFLALESNANSETVGALGLAGSALFGYGQFNYSSKRQKLYLEAADAISCAIIKEGPYLITNDQYAIITQFSKENAYLIEIKKHIESSLIKQEGDDVSGLAALLREVNDFLSTTNTTINELGRIQTNIDAASLRLEITLNHLITATNNGIFDTEPSFQSILSYSQNVQTIANQYIPSNITTQENLDTNSDSDASDIAQMLSGLVDDGNGEDANNYEIIIFKALQLLKDLKYNFNDVLRIIQSIKSKEAAVQSIQNCQINPIAGNLRIIPDINELILEENDKKFITVLDDSGIPIINPNGLSDAVDIDTSVSGGGITITLSTQKIEKDEIGQVLIIDSTGKEVKQIGVNIKKPKENAACTVLTNEQKNYLKGTESEFIKCQEEIKKIQELVKVKVDYKIGKATRTAIETYINNNKAKFTGMQISKAEGLILLSKEIYDVLIKG